jgi:hypothetical protein
MPWKWVTVALASSPDGAGIKVFSKAVKGFDCNVNGLRNLYITATLLLVSPAAAAELPLTIEDLIAEEGRTQLDMSVTYVNDQSQRLSTGDAIIVPTGDASFVLLPTRFGEFESNTDAFIGTLGLRRGVTRDTEIYVRASYLYRNERYGDLSGNFKDTENRFLSSWVGLNHQFSRDGKTPALLGFIEGAAYEKYQQGSDSGKSWALGLTTYRAIDPVVLSVTGSFQWNQERDDGEASYEPGNLFFLTPSVAFAVNDRVTLTSGFKWTFLEAGYLDDEPQGFDRTSTDLTLGLGYGVSKGNTLNVSFSANVSGQSGASLRFNWLYAI